MEKEQTKTFFTNVRGSFKKNCDYAKRNIGNDIERIVRKVFDGRVEFDVIDDLMIPAKGKAEGKTFRIAFKSVEYVDEKVKDQVLYRLVVEHRSLNGKVIENDPVDFMLENVYKWYWAVEKAAKKRLQI